MARASTSSRSARKRLRRSSEADPAAGPSRSDPTSTPRPQRSLGLGPPQSSSPESATAATHLGAIKMVDVPLSTTSPVLTTRAFATSSSPTRSTSQGGHGEEASEDEDERLKHWENFVEEYHDAVIELPLEFRRTFTLVRELEDSQQAATLAFKQQLLAYLHLIAVSYRSAVRAQPLSKEAPAATPQSQPISHVSPPLSETTRRMMLIQVTKAARATIRAAEDKINLTQTLYDLVDRHIQRLDNDLARHEDSFVLGMRPGTLPSHDAPSVSQKEAPGATTSRGAIALGEKEAYEGINLTDDEERYRRGRGGADGRPMVGTDKYMQDERRRLRDEKLRMREEKQRLDTAMGHSMCTRLPALLAPGVFVALTPASARGPLPPVDPNEPTYCFCERVSFGQMVGCENEDCSREWFHFECVGLDAPPIGEWYCRECAATVGRGTSINKKKGR
ncbi:BZ3500_MvSof-1268-A1-R1_Chr4-3g07274 [Microbotryum saponariae]|uniref:Chromatin modification-related protein n=1 Tax=Microbotryum saponariae TaxID=289078 RepID=A0A2X0NMH4_9BASI|nr:BZ3500_MvSof-1268-A1-R1_Chr4-3g07274 [Microbotryum saponariae]SDA06937.1 BZ3501_MvSof-1269-A2-R1_Chr4-2g06983 [Microbotryum saponariae]